MNDDGMFDFPTPPDADAADPNLVTTQERLRQVGAAWRARPLPLAPLLGHLHMLAAEGHADHPPIALQEEMTFMSPSSVAIPPVASRRRRFIVPVVATALLVALSIGFFAFFARHGNTPPISFTSSTVVATPVVTTARGFQRYSTGPYDTDTLITGSDGNIWFAGNREDASHMHAADVGRITPSGTMTIFTVPGTLYHDTAKLQQFYFASYLTQGSDGALWFILLIFQTSPSGTSSFSRIVRVTTSGQMMVFTPPAIVSGGPAPYVNSLTAGPDGALWFSASNSKMFHGSFDYRLGRITTAGAITYHTLPSQIQPIDLVTGPDGAFWFTANNAIERMTLQGSLTSYPVNGPLTSLRFTPDGVLWFEKARTQSDSHMYLGRLDRAHHTITYHTLPTTYFLFPLEVGPDGHIWCSQEQSFNIQKPERHLFTVSTAGTLTEVTLPPDNFSGWVTTGPDGNLWFADFTELAKDTYGFSIAHITP